MAQFQSTSVTGSLTVTGQVIAQTLNVQQVTSSIVYSSGSNIFGNTLGNTQQFTGSVSVTGSLAISGTGAFSGALSLNSSANRINSGNELRFYRTDNGIYTQLYDGGAANGFVLDNRNGDGFSFQTAGTNQLRIASTGAATFSSTIAASGRISTSHSTSGDYAAVFYNTSATGEGVTIRGGSTSSHNAFIVQPYNGATTLFNILATGAATFSSSVTVSGILQVKSTSSSPSIWAGGYGGGITILADNATSNRYLDLSIVDSAGAIAAQGIRVTTVGNVGIGTSSPQGLLQIGANALSNNTDASNAFNLKQTSTTAVTGIYLERSGERKGYYIYMGGSVDSLTFQRNNAGTKADVMSLTRDGTVGIGTDNPGSQVAIEKSSNSGSGSTFPRLAIKNTLATQGDGSSTFNFADILISSGNEAVNMFLATTYAAGTWAPAGIINVSTNHGLQFKTNNTLALTIASTGAATFASSLTVDQGITVSSNAFGNYFGKFGAASTSLLELREFTGDQTATTLILRSSRSDTFYHMQAFNNSSTECFRIESNGNVKNTNSSYGSLSDIKIKENIVDATPKLDDLLKVRIRNYNIIGQEVKQIGVIAQELEEIFPSMVDENQDRDNDGNLLETTTKGVKYSVFVPILIKSIQEQQTQIESLKSENDTLKSILQRNNIS
jgi:hypothetical protein